MPTTDTHPITLTVHSLDSFRPGYATLFTEHCAQEFGWNNDFAERVVTDALRVFAVSAIAPRGEQALFRVRRTMVTSPLVDKVMDTILLNTPLLMWLEDQIGGRMIHEPAYSHGVVDPIITNLRYQFTIHAMQAAGYELDREVIWPPQLPADYVTCSCDNDTKDCTWGFQSLAD